MFKWGWLIGDDLCIVYGHYAEIFLLGYIVYHSLIIADESAALRSGEFIFPLLMIYLPFIVCAYKSACFGKLQRYGSHRLVYYSLSHEYKVENVDDAVLGVVACGPVRQLCFGA